jgi:LysR family glycine cleavage system transcriptional activator
MNRRARVPSISLLEAFEAAARHSSFTRAAHELHLTQSAVSRQVQSLEALLEVALFLRAGRSIRLTEIGAAYAREVRSALDQIRNATAQAIAFRTGVGSLHLAILPTFGSKWLLPRLNDFQQRHPGVLVHIHSRIGTFDVGLSSMDAAITAGEGPWPGLIVHPLLEDDRVLIASPTLLAQTTLMKPEDLYNHVLLGVSTRPQAWQDWFVERGLALRKLRQGTLFEFTAHLIQAVIVGMGVGLVTRVLIEEECRQGSLTVPFCDPKPSRHRYCLVHPPEKDRFPPLVAFRSWLLEQTGPATLTHKET